MNDTILCRFERFRERKRGLTRSLMLLLEASEQLITWGHYMDKK